MQTIKLTIQAISDLIIRLSPKFKKSDGYAFLVHPRDTKDVIIKYPFLKNFSDKSIKTFLKNFWPVTVSEIEGLVNEEGQNIKGWVISCPITADQMLHDRELAKKFIIKTAKLAEKKGAKIIGLGALTASLTRGGLDIEKEVNCKITTGKIFTAKIVTDTLIDALDRLGVKSKDIKISVLGAAGSIGSASAQILAKKGFNNINLVDLSDKYEKTEKIKQILKKLNPSITTTHSENISELKNSDAIIAATNHPDALIKSEHLKSGAIIVDDAQPTDVDQLILTDRPDVMVLEGGAAHSDKINANFKFGLREKGDVYSCLAEVILLTYANFKISYNIGEVVELNFDILEKFEKLADEFGVTIAKLQNTSKIYTDEEIEQFKNKWIQ